MDWTSYYPTYRIPESETEADGSASETKTIGRISKDVEVADIGCGFGGLLVALAPKLPDTLLLGKLLDRIGKADSSQDVKVWRFEHKSRNSCKSESRLCVPRMWKLAYIRMPRV